MTPAPLPPVPPPPRRGMGGLLSYALVALLAAGAGGLVATLAAPGTPAASSASASPSATSPSPGPGSGNYGFPGVSPSSGPSSGAGVSAATEQRVEDAVEPGLVVINSVLQDTPDATGAEGTGMIISSSGLVLTNNHVIDGTTGLTATVVSTGKTYPAKWLGYDKGSDIAVIQLTGASGLTTVPLGNSAAVKVGDGVVAMGNANGTGSITPAAGTITGVNQTITATDPAAGFGERLTGMLETDADIINGDSGGALANTAGQVVGVTTAASEGFTLSQDDAGYAIPISEAVTIVHRIIGGRSGDGVTIGGPGFFGILVSGGAGGGQSTEASPQAQLQQEQQQDSGLGGTTPAPSGCLQISAEAGVPQRIAPVASGTLVLGALCHSPAAAVGLAPGDVITVVDGHQVSAPVSLTALLAKLPAGSTISLTWVTPSGQSITRPVTLAAAPPR